MADETHRETIARLERELTESRAHEKTLGDLLEKKLNEVYVHYHISRTIGSILDLHDLLQGIVEIIRTSLPVESVSVYLLDEEKKRIDLVYTSGLPDPGEVSLQPGQGVPGRIVESGEHVHIHDLSLFHETLSDFIHYPGEERQDGSYIGITLRAHNATIGCIGLSNRRRYGLSVDDMDFLAILSHQIAGGIEKSRLFVEAHRLSQFDALTGLYNYRMFHEKLRQEISRQGRNGSSLSLMMIDIDYFKHFNDTYGHQTGDAVLKQLADIIAGQTRCGTIDICCRYGGEEFAVIMPEQDVDHAAVVAERLRSAVEQTDLQIANGSPGRHAITVSIGVAGHENGPDLQGEELIKRADEALYRSKRNGRNRVTRAPANAPARQ